MKFLRFVVGLIGVLVVFNEASSQVCDNVFPKFSLGLGYSSTSSCTTAGGCWDYSDNSCYSPKVFGYNFKSISSDLNDINGILSLSQSSGVFHSDYERLSVRGVQESASRYHVKIAPLNNNGDLASVWEVPESLIPRPFGHFDGKSMMSVSVDSDSPYQFSIKRGKESLFQFSDNLIFQEQYVQLVLGTPKNTRATFGFGESTRSQQSLQQNTKYTLWNTDYWSGGFDESLYGSHPFFIQLLDDGRAHGFLLVNSNAMEATISRTNDDTHPLIGIQTNGGILDMYFFLGPTPSDVIRQLQEVIGRPAMVPFWSLGLHNCRWGYPDLNYVKDVVANYSAAGIPLETQWVDIDYMKEYRDFTFDEEKFPEKEFKEFVDNLHANNQYFVPIIDPGIYALSELHPEYQALSDGLEMDVFIKDLNGVKPYLGGVWPGPTFFPDWFASNISAYWTKQLKSFHEMVPYDGIWIDMNEVSNFCNPNGDAQYCEWQKDSVCSDGCCSRCWVEDPTNKYDFPPYVPHVSQKNINIKTLSMSTLHAGGIREYYSHNLYGLMESAVTHQSLVDVTGKRPFVLSRSTFLSSGKHAAHWTGDNAASWEDLQASIITMNNLGLFGIPVTGADICGFAHNTNDELCARWIEVGAFSVFTRDHNEYDSQPQELYRWDNVAEASRRVLAMKYRLLPHLYTLLARASASGDTVHNPLWMHFPWDPLTTTRDQQFMWSEGLLFTPVLQAGKTEVQGYFPRGRWYPLMDTDTHGVIETTEGVFVNLTTPLTTTNVHLRGGMILPVQEPGMTTKDVRASPYTLIVALDNHHTSRGKLYLDDGEQEVVQDLAWMEYEAFMGVVTSRISMKQGDLSFIPTTALLGSIEIWGAPVAMKCQGSLFFNHNEEKHDIQVTSLPFASAKGHERVVIDLKASNVPIVSDFKVTWSCL